MSRALGPAEGVFMYVVLFVLVVAFPITEAILVSFGVTDITVIRIVRSLFLAVITWRIIGTLFGDDERRQTDKRWQMPDLVGGLIMVAGFLVISLSWTNSFSVDNAVGSGIEQILPVTFKDKTVIGDIGERIGAAILTFIGLLLIRSALYKSPKQVRPVIKIIDPARTVQKPVK